MSRMVRGWSVQRVAAAAIGFALLIAGVAGANSAFGVLQLQRAYDSAPRCAALADALAGKPCRYIDTAGIVGQQSNMKVLLLDAPGWTFTVTFTRTPEAGPPVDQSVPVELWSGRVTLVDGLKSDANPDVGGPAWEWLALAVLVTAIGAAMLAWSIRRREAGVPAPDLGVMNPLATAGLIYRP